MPERLCNPDARLALRGTGILANDDRKDLQVPRKGDRLARRRRCVCVASRDGTALAAGKDVTERAAAHITGQEGGAPVRRAAVHLIIDMVNPLDFDGAEQLRPAALAAAPRIAALKARARAAGAATVYVNDNFDHWELSFRDLIERVRQAGGAGAALLEHLAPDPDDHFVLKPKHSGFYATSLKVLLGRWRTERLILSGIAGNICVLFTCVLFTANDAHMRDLALMVGSDCIASETAAANDWALEQMRSVMKAAIGPSEELDVEAWCSPASGSRGIA